MKRKMDFEIRRDNDYCRDIFRFYPRRTHVHGFRNTPPADWSEVYKVYYEFSRRKPPSTWRPWMNAESF